MEFSEEQFSKVANRLDKLIPWDLAWGASVAILVERGSTVSVHGSGTLFRIGTDSFVITAGHVIKQAKGANLRILPAKSTDPHDILPLEGQAIVADEEKLDVAAVPLTPDTAEKIDHKRYIRLDNFSLAGDIDAGLFTIFGFPAMMSFHEESTLKVTRFFHMSAMLEGNPTHLAKYEPRYNFLIDANGDETRDLDGKVVDFTYRGGVRARFPSDLGGISGGGVWKILDGPKDRHEGSDPARLVGVETCVYAKPACIQATRWKYVVSLLASARPDLRPAIDLFRRP